MHDSRGAVPWSSCFGDLSMGHRVTVVVAVVGPALNRLYPPARLPGSWLPWLWAPLVLHSGGWAPGSAQWWAAQQKCVSILKHGLLEPTLGSLKLLTQELLRLVFFFPWWWNPHQMLHGLINAINNECLNCRCLERHFAIIIVIIVLCATLCTLERFFIKANKTLIRCSPIQTVAEAWSRKP